MTMRVGVDFFMVGAAKEAKILYYITEEDVAIYIIIFVNNKYTQALMVYIRAS